MVSKGEQDGTSPAAVPPTTSGCPVMNHSNESYKSPASSSTNEDIKHKHNRFWNHWFDSSKKVIPTSDATTSSPAFASDHPSISACPVKGDNNIPASIEEAAKHSQLPVPGQQIPLSTRRSISSIPRAVSETSGTASINNISTTDVPAPLYPKPPKHQPTTSPLWVYPSEQQFYNAMLRKGHKPPIESIPSVLRIHNAVNERSWKQVCKWEKELHGNDNPKLVKFVGRPTDLSPRAWFNSRIWMTQEPFDRHDWYVEAVKDGESMSSREGSEDFEVKTRRYVIDFYEGKENTGHLASSSASNPSNSQIPPVLHGPSMYIDVRPALDSPSDAVDRMTMFMREAFPGISSAYDSYKVSSSKSISEGAARGSSNTDSESSHA